MRTIKTLCTIGLAVAALGITALIRSGNARAPVRFGGPPPLQKIGDQSTLSGRYRGRGPCFQYGCPIGDVSGTNHWTCKQNGEGCLQQK